MTLRVKIPIAIGLLFGGLIVALYLVARMLYQGSPASAVVFFWALWGLSLLFAAATMLYLEKTVLSRLQHLSHDVKRIADRSDPAARISVPGQDELSSLAAAINNMLAALERSQEELRQSEDRLRTIVQNMPAMMIAHDEQGNILAWNQECERVTGYTAEEMIANPQAMERLWPGEAYRKQLAHEWFAHGYNYRDWEWRIMCRDGTVRTVAWSNISQEFPIPGWEAWGIGVDVTARVNAQRELHQRLMEQETLFDISRLISSSLETGKVKRSVADYMARLVDAGRCILLDWDAEAGMLTVTALYQRPELVLLAQHPQEMGEQVGRTCAPSERPLAARAIRARTPCLVYADDPAAGQEERELLRVQRWGGMASIPIVILEQVIGLAEVYLAQGTAPLTEHDLRLLQSLVNQVAVAIHNAHLFAVVQANEAAMRSMSLRLINAQEQERRRIAQELHDELGQLLTACKIDIDLARRKLPAEADAHGTSALARRLQEASDLTDKVLDHVRAMTVDLRPTVLDDMGIVAALSWYLKRFAQRTGIQVEFDAPELEGRLSSEIESTLYRVAQEALTNVARHAQASLVHVRLACADDVVLLAIEDDGQGFDVRAWREGRGERATLGLTGIQERAMLLDGQVRLDSQPGAGTRVEVRLPVQT